MTKVQRTLKLSRELTKEELDRIAHIHAVYGILAARLTPENDLFIEYDYSRLSKAEVQGVLEENGIPLAVD
jgi:hypothetical protein